MSDINREIEKLRFQNQQLKEVGDYKKFPMIRLIVEHDYSESDINRIDDTFDKFQSELDAGNELNFVAVEKEFKDSCKIGRQTLKSVIEAYIAGRLFTDVCYAYINALDEPLVCPYNEIAKSDEYKEWQKRKLVGDF